MGTYNIRLGSKLSFDEEQEADIIRTIESLSSRHKLGQLISDLIRLAIDNPKILEESDKMYERNDTLNLLNSVDGFKNRADFLNSITSEVRSMKTKVDEMYNMVFKTYTLAQMGKHLGLESKSENLLMAQFTIEKQLQELQDMLGTEINSVYASNKLVNTKKLADDILEYIITSYDGITKEISNVALVPIVQQRNVEDIAESKSSKENGNAGTTEESIKENGHVEESIEEKDESVSTDEKDEMIDFGDADLSALSNFFSM